MWLSDHDIDVGYGYQWWLPSKDQGEFAAIGVYNQLIYVYPPTNSVIVKLSANRAYGTSSPRLMCDLTVAPGNVHDLCDLRRPVLAVVAQHNGDPLIFWQLSQTIPEFIRTSRQIVRWFRRMLPPHPSSPKQRTAAADHAGSQVGPWLTDLVAATMHLGEKLSCTSS